MSTLQHLFQVLFMILTTSAFSCGISRRPHGAVGVSVPATRARWAAMGQTPSFGARPEAERGTWKKRAERLL